VTEVIDLAPLAAAAQAPETAKAEPDRNKKRGGKSAPAEDNKEFWETWAETKTTRPEPVVAAAAETESAATEEAPAETGGRSRGKRGGRDRDKRETKMDKPEAKPAKDDEKPAGRTKRDAAPEAAPAAASDSAQARLFVNLGKKHGVSADDLRGLLAAPLGGDKARIGSVSLRDSHAHVRVPEETVDAIIAGVHGTQHNDQAVTVERARA
jgi:hypothetical protein